jgi:hypothetical protein
MSTDKDLNQKLRIMRFWWYNGYFTRMNVDIFRYEHGQKTSHQYTDIDVFGIKFQENFMHNINICDCKSGQISNKDRIFWTSGLMNYIGANQAIFLAKNIDESKYYDLGKNLNVIPLSNKRLSELEKTYKLDSKPIIGPFNYDNILLEEKIFEHLKTNLKEVYDYLKTIYWVESPNKQISSLMTCLKDIESIIFVNNNEKIFLLIYCLSLFSISLLKFSEPLLIFPNDKKEYYIQESLLGGEIESSKMKELFSSFYKFMIAEIKIRYKKLYPMSERDFIGFLYSQHNKYTIDLIERISLNPVDAIQIPRFLDIIAYESVLNGKNDNINEKMFSYNHLFDISNVCKLTKDLFTFAERSELISPDSFDEIINYTNSFKIK